MFIKIVGFFADDAVQSGFFRARTLAIPPPILYNIMESLWIGALRGQRIYGKRDEFEVRFLRH